MAELLAFAAAEVAFVLREPVKALKKALDEGPVEPKLVLKAGGCVRAVEMGRPPLPVCDALASR